MRIDRLRGIIAALLFVTVCACSATRTAPPPDPITSAEALEFFESAWSTVNETHYDPTFNGVDWDALREELLPRAREASTETEIRTLVGEMLGRLDQSHFSVIPKDALPTVRGSGDEVQDEDTAGDLGFDVRLCEGLVLVSDVYSGGAAEAAGVRRGWVLTRIDEREVAELLESPDDVDERTAYFATWRAITESRSLGPIGSTAELAFLDRDDDEVVLDLERRERDVIAHAFGNLPTFYLRFRSDTFERDGKSIGWVHFTNWFLPLVQPLNAALDGMRGLDGIVLDLRGNTGGAGAMVMGIAGHFFAERVLLGTMTTREAEVKFLALPRKVNEQGKRIKTFAGPVAILIDGTSGSASEMFAGGMQSTGRVRVFGETTMGAVLPSTVTVLPNGDALLHAMGDFKTSTGVLLEGDGVIPDVYVPLTRAALLADHDPQLETALAWIAGQDAN